MTIFGHPVHPMLIPFPIAGFTLGLLSLLAFAVGDDPLWLRGAYWLVIVGVVTGLGAGVFGFADWRQYEDGSRKRQIGLWHMGANIALIALFFISWLFMGGFGGVDVDTEPAIPIAFQVVGVLLLGAAGWLGGEMVYGTEEEVTAQAEQQSGPQRRAA